MKCNLNRQAVFCADKGLINRQTNLKEENILTDTFNLLTRSSHQRCSIKKGVLKNFAKFTGKHLCWRLFFDKVAGLRLPNLLKKRLQHRCFPVNFAKFLRAPIL